MKKVIGVIGASNPTSNEKKLAYEVGKLIAKKGAVLICGGLGGVMEEACRGAMELNGLTVGVLPGGSKNSANKYVDIPIVTSMGQARNVIIVSSSDAVISVGGGYGTLSEIATALKLNIPLIGLLTWEVKGVKLTKANSPDEAVGLALKYGEVA